jgi:hypothetical protein
MGSVNRARRPGASTLVTAKLVQLGYLKPAKRYRPDAVDKAVERLKRDLWHVGAIEGGDLTKIDKASRGSAKQEKQVKRRSTASAHANGQHYLPPTSLPVAKPRE